MTLIEIYIKIILVDLEKGKRVPQNPNVHEPKSKLQMAIIWIRPRLCIEKFRGEKGGGEYGEGG